jgi:hypothetical protein
MFETEGKKILRTKRNAGKENPKDVTSLGGSSSVYNELKLSEMLSDSLEDMKARYQAT